MATINRFQDLEAWQLARALNREVYGATARGSFSRDFALRDQIRRASISISSNIAEGFGRRSPADFARFLTIAKASAAEVHSQLYLALDLDYLSEEDFGELASGVERVSRVIGGLLSYLRSARGQAREPDLTYDINPELGTQNPEPTTT